MSIYPPPDWTPLALDLDSKGAPFLEWVYLGGRRFVEPFWEQTVEKCLGSPFASLFVPRTPLAEASPEDTAEGRVLPPLGFVFHVSRCGSTLVSRLIGTLPEIRVLSEAGPLDAALRIREKHPNVSEEEHRSIVRNVWAAMARRRFPEERGVVVKWDAWSTASLPLLRAVFPDVPVAFVYRDPREVLASHQTSPGLHMVPGQLPPGLFGFAADARLGEMPLGLYQAQVLRSFYEVGIASFEPIELVSYADLPEAVWTRLMPRFGIAPAAPQVAVLREQAGFSAKNPALFFESDGAAKQALTQKSFTPEVAALLMPLYETLEKRRASLPECAHQPSASVSAT